MGSCRLFPSVCGKKEISKSETLWWKVLDMVDLEMKSCVSAHAFLRTPGTLSIPTFDLSAALGLQVRDLQCSGQPSAEACSWEQMAVLAALSAARSLPGLFPQVRDTFTKATRGIHFHPERYPLQAPRCVLRRILSIQKSFGIRLRMRLWPFQNYESTAWKAKDCVSVLLRKLSVISEEADLWMQYCLAKSAVSHLHVLPTQVSSQNVISLPHYICS